MAPIRNKKVDISTSQENDSPDTSSWKLNAASNQQIMCNNQITHDWDAYKWSERGNLEKKVNYLIYGPTENGIDKDKKDLIENICRKIVEEGINSQSSESVVYMTFIYVFWSKSDSNLHGWPVFKVPKNDDKSDALFIDINARVYKDWNDFLKNNKFPPCEYCFPKGGVYTTDEEGIVILEFELSPANKPTKKLVEYLDFTNAGLSLGTTVVTAASLFLPVAPPLLLASSWLTRGICAYATVRSGTTLYDRGIHKQSVGLGDSETRSCWLAILASSVGMASSSASNVTQKMAQSGQVVGKIGCATTNALIFCNVAVNGMGILHNLHGLMEKYKRNQLSSLDVFQLSASMLLFAHAVVNVKTAKSIIENTQDKVLQDFENNLRSNRHRKIFRKVARNTKNQQNTVEGKAKVIRALSYIDNVDDFFAALARMDKQFRPTGSKVTLEEGGFVEVNGHLSIDPTQFVEASIDDRILLLEATKKYVSNQMSEIEFRELSERILGEIPSIQQNIPKNFPSFPSLRDLLRLGKDTLRNLPQGEFRFSYPLLNAYERMELMVLLKKFAESDHENILRMASVLFKNLGFTLGEQYVEVAFFVCGLIKNVANNAIIDRSVGGSQCSIPVNEYCAAALKEYLQDPSKLLHIFEHVRMLFSALSTKSNMPTQFRHVSLFEIAEISTILLRIDEPFWLRCLQFSEKITHILGLTHYGAVIKIIKRLCLYINQTLQDMERKHYYNIPDISNKDDLWAESSVERADKYCNMILDTVSSDSEIQQSLLEEIWKSKESCPSNNSHIILKYTKQQPLELPKKFWNGNELTLLSEEEILYVCKLALEADSLPVNCPIEYDGCNIFVNVDDKLVTIKCMIGEEQISAFVDRAVTL